MRLAWLRYLMALRELPHRPRPHTHVKTRRSNDVQWTGEVSQCTPCTPRSLQSTIQHLLTCQRLLVFPTNHPPRRRSGYRIRVVLAPHYRSRVIFRCSVSASQIRCLFPPNCTPFKIYIRCRSSQIFSSDSSS